jgi:hypothetical protein
MIDIPKHEGLVEGIEMESKIPHPSHANLARLVAMFCRELLNVYAPEHHAEPSETKTIDTASEAKDVSVDFEEPKTEPLTKHKGKKKKA